MLTKVLENEFLLIEVSSLGAELLRVFDKKRNLELLYDASSNWSSRSPILFPYIGVPKHNLLGIYDEKYKAFRHGFVRDKEFSLTITDNKIISTYSSDNENDYPFSTTLQICYELNQNSLKVFGLITNHSLNTMYYHFGFHPGFFVSSNAYIKLSSNKHKELILLKEKGLLTKHELIHKEDTLYINDNLFVNDTYITLNNYHNLSLYSNSDKLFDLYTTAPVIAFWRKNNQSNFVCIEPWFGICDYDIQGDHITDKRFINRLLPKDTAEHSFILTV